MMPALMLVATLVAVGLLIAVIFRMGTRFDDLSAELERMKVVQRDMSSDVRTRLEEGARTWESVEGEIRPKLQHLESLEPAVASLSAALDENLPALTDARQRLEAVEARAEGTEARVTAALETGSEATAERCERIEQAVRTLRNAADERLADVGSRVMALEDAATVPAAAAEEAPAPADTAETPPAETTTATPPPIPESIAARSRPEGSRPSRSRGTDAASPQGASPDEEGSSGGRWLIALVLFAGTIMLIAALT